MIRAEIIGVPAVTARLKKIPPTAQQQLSRSVGRLCLQLERKVKHEKLTGQVLHVRTDKLRGSIHTELSSSDTAVTGIVGTNVEYAAVHEYGFTGQVSVRGYLRKIIETRRLSLRGNNVLKHPIKTTTGMATVRPFTRRMHLPERSFLRSALREMTPEIQAQLHQAVNDALGGTA